MSSLIQPFGEVSFEIEEKKLGNLWEQYFFEHTNFVSAALESETYLIVGRRGSGKSSLGEFFSHQNKIKNSSCIYLGKAEEYEPHLYEIAKKLSYSSELATQKLVELWDYLIWQIIFKHISQNDNNFRDVIDVEFNKHSYSSFLKLLIEGLLNKFIATTGSELVEFIGKKKNENKIKEYKNIAKVILKKKPIFVLVDSREQYDINNEYEMWITAALVQCASEMNIEYTGSGVHIKVGIADEVFPYIEEKFITNTIKYIRNPLRLHWRPRDLIRLVCWRFFKYLSIYNLINYKESDVDWESFEDIYKKIWIPHFGEFIVNRRNVKEKTLPYILRHTHLRPRQLIMICNRISKIAFDKGKFPYFDQDTIVEGILDTEVELANGLLNSYRNIYPNCADIIAALEGMPIEFSAKELDRIAPRTASQWKHIDYSPFEFTRLLVELGVIGRKKGGADLKMGIIKADFEFSLKDRIYMNEKNTCVVHPMFYAKLNTNRNNPSDCFVYPFPDHPDFDLLHKM